MRGWSVLSFGLLDVCKAWICRGNGGFGDCVVWGCFGGAVMQAGAVCGREGREITKVASRWVWDVKYDC